MTICAYRDIVIAKIISQGCKLREDLDDEFSLYFSVEYRGHSWVFAIPQPLEQEGYTQRQLEVIEVQLARLGLDLLPLDQHMH